MLPNNYQIALDTCQYPEGQTPDARLGRIWAQWQIPDEQRVAMSRHFKAIGQMANLASSVQDFEGRIETLLKSSRIWPEDEAAQIVLRMNWLSVWKDATRMVNLVTEQETEAKKDPHKVTDIPDLDLANMWDNFRSSPRGQAVLLNEHTSPHKVFLSQVKRDFTVHHILQQYPLKRIFLERDPVDAIPHWAKSMDNMLKISGHVDPIKEIGSLEEVDYRMQALWIAADLCGICAFTYEAGPVRLLHIIRDRRESTSDKYTFTVRCDAVLRRAIYHKSYYEKSKYPTCELAIRAVIGTRESPGQEAERLIERTLHELVRQDAGALVEATMQNIGATAGTRFTTPTKVRGPRAEPGLRDGPSRSALKKQRQRVKQARSSAAQQAEIGRLKQQLAKGKGKGKDRAATGNSRSAAPYFTQKAEVGADRGTKRQKMPEHEFQALREIKATEKNGKKACRFWNSSIGCSAPEGTCAFAHDLCILCGQNHRWCEHHQPLKSGNRR